MSQNKITIKNQPEYGYFLSEILGSRIFLGGKKIGKLTDLVIKENGVLPVVTHLFISRPFGETSLIPWEKVISIKSGKIEIVVDRLEDCEKEPSEEAILLRDHILDKKVLDLGEREVEVVYDIKLVLKNNKLYVSDVDLSRYGLLRRLKMKGLANFIYRLAEDIREQTISWTYIEPLPSNIGRFKGDVKLNILREKLSDMHPVDLADVLEQLDHEQRVALFDGLEQEQASDTLEEIDPYVQRDLVSSLKREKAAQLINDMTTGQAADVLAVLPGSEAKPILDLLDQENKTKIQFILEQQDEHILNYATSDILKFYPDQTVEKVQDEYRLAAKGKDVIMYLYVVDPEDHLKGVIDIKELLQANDEALLKDVMVDNLIHLEPESTLKDASEMFTRYGFRAIPILDENQKILGVVTYRDVMNLKHRFLE
jgi:magnesium transporter